MKSIPLPQDKILVDKAQSSNSAVDLPPSYWPVKLYATFAPQTRTAFHKERMLRTLKMVKKVLDMQKSMVTKERQLVTFLRLHVSSL